MIAAVMTLGVIAPNFFAMPADTNNQERQAMVRRFPASRHHLSIMINAPALGAPPLLVRVHCSPLSCSVL